MRTRDYKAALEEIANGYQEARDEEFNQQLIDFLPMDKKIIVTEDDLQGFLDSFTFPDEADWCADEYEEKQGAYADAKYEEMRDDR